MRKLAFALTALVVLSVAAPAQSKWSGAGGGARSTPKPCYTCAPLRATGPHIKAGPSCFGCGPKRVKMPKRPFRPCPGGDPYC
jgi:hypothetical protein